jgi:cytoskeletal protein CcmA (bactofilin family)
MRRPLAQLFRTLSATLVVVWGCLTTQTSATEFRGGDAIQIRGTEILDDLFLAGGDINVDAHVVGDLFTASATVQIGDSAVIENSFMGAARRVDLNGTVVNSARVFAQDLNVRGHVQRNLMAFTASMITDGASWIENDVSAYCGSTIIRGRIGGDLTGEVGQLVISGQIDGDIDVRADEITILPTAIVGGKLRYLSKNEAKIEEGAQIFGGVNRVTDDESKRDAGYTFGSFLWDVWWYLAAVAVGLTLLVLFRGFVLDVRDAALGSSWSGLGLGFLFLICTPVAAGVLAITLLGIPLAILIMLTWVVLLYVAKIFVALAVGHWLLGRFGTAQRSTPFMALCTGLLLITLATLIPVLGCVVQILIVSLGFGAFLMAAYRRRLKSTGATTA